jgi:ATP-dependent helicase/nuclease subunit A
MAERTWTPEQLQGIELTGQSLLLSAAAGSGKTAVLAERCAHLVCGASEPCDVDELLVVTFTEAAAAEMRGRIDKALRARIGKSDDARLSRQLALIERASVSTLHSFCSRILRQHFHVLGIDPGFTVLDASDAALLRLETARELVHSSYEGANGPALASLVDAVADGQDESIVSAILHLHELMCSVVDPQRWLDTAVERIAEGAKGPIDNCALGQSLKRNLTRHLSGASRRCSAAIDRIRALRDFPKYIDQLGQIANTLESWQGVLRTKGLDALAVSFSNRAPAPRAPSYSSAKPGKPAAKAAFDSVRDELKSGPLSTALRFSCAQWEQGLTSTLPHAKLLVSLVQDFGKKYADEKSKLRALDFSDLERLALRALRGADGAPSSVARLHHRQYKHVLVDEYQDINEVQDTILNLISHECQPNSAGNLFAVGDVKQSIYRFRLAEPQRFLTRAKNFREKKQPGKVIDLRANFRSRAKLIDAINAFFERVMTEESVDIEYDETHRLSAGLQYPPSAHNFPGAPVELHILPDEAAAPDAEESDDVDDSDRTDREAWLIARRIRELFAQKFHIFDKDRGEYRPLKYSDIAILMRTAAVKAQQIATVLREQNIPAHAEGRSGFFEATEVRDLLCLLEILDNQQQDVPLAGFLRSPLANLAHPEDALARIRLAFPDISFHEAVTKYATDRDDELAARLRDILATLQRWRTNTTRRPIAEILWTIYDETGYLAFVTGLLSGDQRKANLLLLHERARQFGTFQKQGLSRFMTFLRSLAKDSDLGQASVASDADDVVKILSIHQSKGLEFPVVFVPDLGKKFNLSDTRGPLLADRETYLGLMVVDDVKKIRYPSLAYHLVQQRLLQQTLAEEMRILYVAMTRAKEHLILIGTAREKSIDAWSLLADQPKLPADAILSARTMLDWIFPGAAGLSEYYQLRRYTSEEVASWPQETARPPTDKRFDKLARLDPLIPAPPSDPDANQAIARLAYEYPHRGATLRPAAASVTRIVKHSDTAKHTDDFVTPIVIPAAEDALRRSLLPLLPLPRCCAAATEVAGTDIGTATHIVLQHLDFASDISAPPSAVPAQIDRLVARHILTEEQAKLIDHAAIEWFFTSELGQLFRKNYPHIRRELPLNFSQTIDGAAPLDCTMIRGRIDLLLISPEQLILADYKTDRVPPSEVSPRADLYAPQLKLYRTAIQEILGRKVTRTSLIFLHAREIRDME